MLFDEKKHERGREDEVSHATNFLFSRIQELESSLLSQRMALESSRQRELGLHNTIQGFQQLIAARGSQSEMQEVKTMHLSSLVDSLTEKNKLLSEENSNLRQRLESTLTVMSGTSGGLRIEGNCRKSPGVGNGAGGNLSASFSQHTPPPTDGGGVLFSSSSSSFAVSSSTTNQDLASATQQLALLQLQFRECNKQLNILVGILNHFLSSSSIGTSTQNGVFVSSSFSSSTSSSSNTSSRGPSSSSTVIPRHVKDGIADVCNYIFQRDGSLPSFLYEYVKRSTAAGNRSSLSGQRQHAEDSAANHQQNVSSTFGEFPSSHRHDDHQHGTATVSMLLRRNDELQKKLMDLGVSS